MSYSAFFYGTLLHPKVLKRVIGNDGQHLQISPAILLDHTRHRIKDCDYPGVIPYGKSRQLFNRELSQDERCVRGNLVVGLSVSDIHCLDVFEGDEYERRRVQVHPIGKLEPMNQASDYVLSHKSASLPHEFIRPIEAHTYIWSAPTSLLVPELWSYEVFIRDCEWRWVGASDDQEREEYKEVDRRRQMNGVIVRSAEIAVADGVLN